MSDSERAATPLCLRCLPKSLPWSLVGLFLVQNLLARIGAILISRIRPITLREQSIPVWPPSRPFFVWFERIWLAPLERWDTVHYLGIVRDGYDNYSGTAQFHPLYPGLAQLLHRSGFSPLAALVLVAFLSAIGLLIAVWVLADLDFGPATSETSMQLLLASPFAFALFLPYSESLFLLCSVLAFYWARKSRWWLAGTAGALAVLTRQQGLFLLLPLSIEWLLQTGWITPDGRIGLRLRDKSLARSAGDDLGQSTRVPIPLLLVPFAYVAWVGYRGVLLDDLRVSLNSIQSFVYSVLISPSATQVVAMQTFTWPWHALHLAIQKLVGAPDLDIVVNMIGSVWYLFILLLAWPHMRFSYRVYTLVNTLVSFSYTTGPYHPYMGLLRHLLLGFPVFFGLGAWARSRTCRGIAAVVGFLGFYALFLLHILHARVP